MLPLRRLAVGAQCWLLGRGPLVLAAWMAILPGQRRFLRAFCRAGHVGKLDHFNRQAGGEGAKEAEAAVAASSAGGEVEMILSDFAEDPDLAEVIHEFVAGLPAQMEQMRVALANGYFEELQRLAHQLRGAGGSYGYPTLTDVAPPPPFPEEGRRPA